MSYRKARTRHNEISLWLTYSTYRNTAGKNCLSTTQQQYPLIIQQMNEWSYTSITNRRWGLWTLIIEEICADQPHITASCLADRKPTWIELPISLIAKDNRRKGMKMKMSLFCKRKKKYTGWRTKYTGWRMKYTGWRTKYTGWRTKYTGWRTKYTGWRTKCHTFDCARNTFLLLQKHLTSGTELIFIGWKIVPNEEHVQCDHRFAPQPLANEPLHSSQLFDRSLQKARGTTSLCSCATFSDLLWRPENLAQLRAHIVKLWSALSEDLCRKVVTNARVRLQEIVRHNGGHIEHVLH